MRLIQDIHEWFHRQRRKLATAAVGLLTLYIAFHVIFGTNGMVAYAHKRAESQKLDKEIQSLQQENGRLNVQIDSLKNDPKAIEKEAREQLRYTRPGEVVYTLPAQPKAAEPPAPSRDHR
jgi:cell division protein FtsB